jgi:protein TonB
MANKLFSSLQKEKVKTGKWLFIPFSFLMHALLIFSLTIGPFLDANSQMPDYRVIDGIQFVNVPLPPIPRGSGNGGSGKGKSKGPGTEKPKPVQAAVVNEFVAPIEISDTIEEGDLWDAADDSLDVNTVEGAPSGDGGWGVPGGADSPWLKTSVDPVLKPVRIKSARLIRRVKPVYPPTALAARIQGVVVVEAVTNIYGKVVSVSLRKGIPLLNQAALDAVKKWIYEPYVVGGIPKPVVFTVTVNFSLRKQ